MLTTRSQYIFLTLVLAVAALGSFLLYRFINIIRVKNLAATDKNVKAFLMAIRTGEGTTGPNGYRTHFGGSLFSSYADHPRKVITAGGYSSSAAGAYQFLTRTWDEVKAKLNLPDFSPASQDAAAVELIRRRGALEDVVAGRFATALHKCAPEWASLPTKAGKSYYGQPVKSLATLQKVYTNHGGTIA